MNKILITGLGIGKSLGICDACNLDYSWIVDNPATFIWTDKICIPKDMYGKYSSRDEKQANALKLIMDIADSEGIIDKITVPDSVSAISTSVYQMALEDAKQIAKQFPESVKKGDVGVPDELIIDGAHYCGPYIGSIYASITLADHIGANCIFDRRALAFLKYKYGLEMQKYIHGNNSVFYNEIFQLLIPDQQLLPPFFAEDQEKCVICKNYIDCNDSYLFDIEKNMKKIIEWRKYEEIGQVKEVINSIIWKKNSLVTDSDVEDAIRQFNTKKQKINDAMSRAFPRIQRWANIVTFVASPLAMYSFYTGTYAEAALSTTLAGVSAMVDKGIDIYKSKNNWVSFFTDNNSKVIADVNK